MKTLLKTWPIKAFYYQYIGKKRETLMEFISKHQEALKNIQTLHQDDQDELISQLIKVIDSDEEGRKALYHYAKSFANPTMQRLFHGAIHGDISVERQDIKSPKFLQSSIQKGIEEGIRRGFLIVLSPYIAKIPLNNPSEKIV